MRKPGSVLLAAVLAIAGALAGTASHAQTLSNLPPNTVVGRLGAGIAGPAQAIPFVQLLANLSGLPGVIAGPANSTIGHIASWNNVSGLALADSGVALSGTGTLAFGSGNTLTLTGGMTLTGGGTLNVASSKTLTDTSGIGAVLALGTTTGGFTGYAGASCASNSVTAISTAGAVTCTGRAATNSTVASPTAPNSTSAFKMQGLAGTITPAVSGKILITISGTITNASGTAGVGVQYQISYGTSTAPTSNAALAGTQVGTIQEYLNPATVTAADVQVPFSISVVVTGLTLSTAYWIDIAAESVSSASQAGFSNVNISAAEI